MATSAEWATAYARQADADFTTFQALQLLTVPQCHKLQFLQMACEKLVKAHLCGEGTDPGSLQQSHAYIAATLPVVLRQQALFVNFGGSKAKTTLKQAAHLAGEIELLAPAVKRGGRRPDNCEYPWEDNAGILHTPLDWSFPLSQLIILPGGRTILKLIRGAIHRLVP
ncbi:MAG: hypothetical protein ACYC3I_24605 [Gemmataceae bacterium]